MIHHVRFSEAAQEVMRQATYYAQKCGDGKVRVEDILHGLLADQSGPLRTILARWGQEPNKLRSTAATHINPCGPGVDIEVMKFTKEASLVVMIAKAEAWEEASHEVGPLHILKALLLDEDLSARQRLVSLGITKQTIQKEFPVPKNQGPNHISEAEISLLKELVAEFGLPPTSTYGALSLALLQARYHNELKRQNAMYSTKHP